MVSVQCGLNNSEWYKMIHGHEKYIFDQQFKYANINGKFNTDALSGAWKSFKELENNKKKS